MKVQAKRRLTHLGKQDLHYDIWGYTLSQGMMAVRVSNVNITPPIPDFIVCGNVIYFSGPLQWRGVIRIGSPDELLSLLRFAGHKHFPDEYLLENYTLLQIDSKEAITTTLVAQWVQVLSYQEVEELPHWPFAEVGYPPF